MIPMAFSIMWSARSQGQTLLGIRKIEGGQIQTGLRGQQFPLTLDAHAAQFDSTCADHGVTPGEDGKRASVTLLIGLGFGQGGVSPPFLVGRWRDSPLRRGGLPDKREVMDNAGQAALVSPARRSCARCSLTPGRRCSSLPGAGRAVRRGAPGHCRRISAAAPNNGPSPASDERVTRTTRAYGCNAHQGLGTSMTVGPDLLLRV